LKKSSRWFIALLSVLLLLTTVTGCNHVASESSETGPTTIAPVPADWQDSKIRPEVVWLPDNSHFSIRGIYTGLSGWLGVGQSVIPYQDNSAQVDFYQPDGQLGWTWQRPRQGGESCYLSAAALEDGTLLAGGRLVVNAAPEIGLLTAFDQQGQMIWETTLDYPDDPNMGLSFIQLTAAPDHQIYAAGWATLYHETGSRPEPVLIASYDAQGRLLWQKLLDFGGTFYSTAICPAGQAGVYVAVQGYIRNEDGSGDQNQYLVYLDTSGQEIWRRTLSDDKFDYVAMSLTINEQGQLFAACSASSREPLPTPMPSPSVFHDRYRSFASNPAALLCFELDGDVLWQRYLNGNFGAGSQQVYCDDNNIYWLVSVHDDVVPPYIFMSIDHRVLSHLVLAVCDDSTNPMKIWQFERNQSGDQLIQRIENGQAVMIGIEPFIPPPEWETETFIPGQG